VTTILHKRGSGIPTADKFEAVGEILIDSETGIAYTLNDAGEVVSVGGDDIWLASDPDEFGHRVVTFPDQISNPDDIHDFYIRYSTDPEQGTISRATINAYKFYGKYIEAIDIKASDSVETKEVIAAAVETVASVSVEQVVVGGIVVGDTAPITSSFSEEQKAEAMGLQSALKIIKPLPDPLPNKVTIDIDKDGNITAEGVVQAADYLDADGNSIVGAGDDYDDSQIKADLASETEARIAGDADLQTQIDNLPSGGGDLDWVNGDEDKFIISLGWENNPSSRGVQQVLIGSEVSAKEGGVAIGQGADAGDQSVAVGRYSFAGAGANSVAIGNGAIANEDAIGLGSYANAASGEFAIGTGINAVNFSGATVQATDFLDADGNSIIGAGGGEALWEQSGSDLYYSAGNVGIGVTPLGSSSGAFTQLQIGGGSGQSTLFGQNNDHAIGMASGAYYDASNNLKYSSSAKGLSRLYLYDGTFQFSSAPSGTEGATATLTERMRIDGATGNVGIGADVTTFRFNVETSNSTTTNLKSTSEISNLRLTNSGGLAVVGSEGNDLVFSASTSEKMRIGSDGSVKVVSKADGQELTISQGYNSYMYASNDLYLGAGGDSELAVLKGNGNFSVNGRVGIGGQPSRSAGEYLEQAKTKIAGWKTTFDARLKAEPKADKEAVTLEITDGDFSVFPTAEALAEKMAERAIGGGDAKLQVAGDGYFTTDVHASGVLKTDKYINVNNNGYIRGEYSGELRIQSGSSKISFYNNQNNSELAYISNAGNAFFSGTVQATDFLDADGNPATVSPSRMVDAFTTLQTAIADETTIEGIKTALTNSLGGLIEKFEGLKNG